MVAKKVSSSSSSFWHISYFFFLLLFPCVRPSVGSGPECLISFSLSAGTFCLCVFLVFFREKRAAEKSKRARAGLLEMKKKKKMLFGLPGCGMRREPHVAAFCFLIFLPFDTRISQETKNQKTRKGKEI